MPPMPTHLSPGNMLLDVILVIYNFICLIGTFSNHQSDTDKVMMTRRLKEGPQNIRQTATFDGAPCWPTPIKNPAYAADYS